MSEKKLKTCNIVEIVSYLGYIILTTIVENNALLSAIRLACAVAAVISFGIKVNIKFS